MILRCRRDATVPDRASVELALARLDVEFERRGDFYHLKRALDQDDALAIAAMSGVKEIRSDNSGIMTVGDVLTSWVASGTTVLGVLILIAAQFPAQLGSPVAMLQTPANLHPEWPMLPWFEAIEQAPAWLPVSFLPIVSIFVLLLWPLVGRRIAERRPRLHTIIGIVVAAAALALGLMGALR